MNKFLQCDKFEYSDHIREQIGKNYQIYYNKVTKSFIYRNGINLFQLSSTETNRLKTHKMGLNQQIEQLTFHQHFQVYAYQIDPYTIGFSNQNEKQTIVQFEGKEGKHQIIHFEWVYGTQRNVDFFIVETGGVRYYKLDEEKCTLKNVKTEKMTINYSWYEPIKEVLACCNDHENGKIHTFHFNEKKQSFKYKGPDFVLDNAENENLSSSAISNQEADKKKQSFFQKGMKMFSNQKINFQAFQERRNHDLMQTQHAPENMNKIFMLNIYSKSYLLFLNAFSGKIHLYTLSYEKITRPSFAITVPSDNTTSVSVVDNLLVIHSHDEYMSMIYDIKRSNPTMPIGPPQPIQIKQKSKEKQYIVKMNLIDDIVEKVEKQDDSEIRDFSQHSNSQMYGKNCIFLADDLVADIQTNQIFRFEVDIPLVISLVEDKIDVFQIMLRRQNAKNNCMNFLINMVQNKQEIMLFSVIFRTLFEIYKQYLQSPKMILLQQSQLSDSNLSSNSSSQQSQQQQQMLNSNLSLKNSNIKLNKQNSSNPNLDNKSGQQNEEDQALQEQNQQLQEEEKIKNGYTVISPENIQQEFFKIIYLDSDISREYLIEIMSEYIRQFQELKSNVQNQEIGFLLSTQQLFVKLILKSNRMNYMHFLLQYHILQDTSELAKQLIELSSEERLRKNDLLQKYSPYPQGFQLGIDMLYRLKKYHDIFDLFLKRGMFQEALELMKKYQMFNKFKQTYLVKKFTEVQGNMTKQEIIQFFKNNLRRGKNDRVVINLDTFQNQLEGLHENLLI